MNTRDFEIVNTINDYYLQISAPSAENCDVIAERVIMNDCPNFIIPINCMNINGKKIYRYNIGTNIVYKYFNHSMTTSCCLTLLKNIISPLMSCKDWFIDYSKFYLDAEYVFIDKNTLNVKYIYTFDKSFSCTDDDIKKFITDIVNEINIIGDNSIQLDLYKYVLGRNFSLEGVWELISDYEKKHPSEKSAPAAYQEPVSLNNIRNEQAPVPPAPVKIPEMKSEPAVQFNKELNTTVQEEAPAYMSGDMDDDIAELMQNLNSGSSKKQPAKKKGGFLGNIFGKKLETKIKTDEPAVKEIKQNVPEPAYAVNREERIEEKFSESNDETVFEVYDYTEQNAGSSMVMLELVSSTVSNMPERIMLDVSKGYVTIGRKSSDERNRADYEMPLEAKKISRCHLRIEKSNDEYYAIDLGSSNGTKINGERLIPNQSVKISADSKIAFAQDLAVYRFVIR